MKYISVTKYILIAILYTFLSCALHESTVYASTDPITNNWYQELPFPYPISTGEFFAHNNKIYVMTGGGYGLLHTNVITGDIDSSGHISGWTTIGNFPQAIMWNTVAKNGNDIYILGGATESSPVGHPTSLNTVYFNTINTDGSLQTWQSLTPLPQNLANGKALIYKNYLYYFGGSIWNNGSSTLSQNVYMAPILPNGTIGSWNALISIPEARFQFTAFINNNRITIVGGGTNTSASESKIITTLINDSNGTISSWETLPNLPTRIRYPLDYNDGTNYILLGGYNGSSFTKTIYYSPIGNDNKPTNWFLNTTSLPTNNCCTSAVVNGNKVYIIGGHDGSNYFTQIYSTDISVASSTLNVPNIKQYSTPWNDDEYDSANSWKPVPKNTSVARWGCAMTSAAMILQYNGYTDVEPDDLNTWLKDNNGYNREGGILWTAVSKYTKDHKDDYSPALKSLEFAYHNVNDENIISEINTSKHPAIFKMENATSNATHFIVGKGVKDKVNPTDTQDYLVNDPDSSTNSTLSESEDDFNMKLYRYGIFTPSNTDLSYVILFVDHNVNLKVFDTNGYEITNGYFKEGSILDGEDKTDISGSGKTLNAFYLPKPSSGTYKVEVAGNGNYQLDRYLYDVNGNVKVENTLSSVAANDKDIYLIQFNHENITNSTTQQITFQRLLQLLAEDRTKGLITNNGAYTSIKNMIENSQSQFGKTNISLSKQFLNSAVSKIQYYTSIAAIDPTASLKLTQYLQFLLETY